MLRKPRRYCNAGSPRERRDDVALCAAWPMRALVKKWCKMLHFGAFPASCPLSPHRKLRHAQAKAPQSVTKRHTPCSALATSARAQAVCAPDKEAAKRAMPTPCSLRADPGSAPGGGKSAAKRRIPCSVAASARGWACSNQHASHKSPRGAPTALRQRTAARENATAGPEAKLSLRFLPDSLVRRRRSGAADGCWLSLGPALRALDQSSARRKDSVRKLCRR